MSALSFAAGSSLFPTFSAGMVLSMSLIMAIGPQNAHVLRMGLQRQHLWLTVAVCALSDVVLISLGVLGLAQLGGLSDKLMGALIGAGVLFLGVYGWQAFQRFLKPQQLALLRDEDGRSGPAPAPVSPRQAILSALAFPGSTRTPGWTPRCSSAVPRWPTARAARCSAWAPPPARWSGS